MAMNVAFGALAGALLAGAYEGVRWLSGKSVGIQLDTPTEHLAPYPEVAVKLHELETIFGSAAVRPLVQHVDRLARVAPLMASVSDPKVRAAAVNMAHRMRHSIKVSGARLGSTAGDKPEATQHKITQDLAALDEFANRIVNDVDCMNERQ